MVRLNLRRKIQRRISIFRRCILRVWNQFLMCSFGKPIQYHMLQHPILPSQSIGDASFPMPPPESILLPPPFHARPDNSDLVNLKISLLGDSRIGKTSFLAKYVGDENEMGMQKDGMNTMDKTLMLSGARITYSLWEVDGAEGSSMQQIPVACKDSVAILIMFDLTSRVTLNGVIRWYQEARRWNQNAIPILIGTKFDDFIQLPIDLQWAIASQARAYAKALNATLFFSSATYNINVNKIFKFVTAKIFDLPWTPERNLTIGEPIIDF
ncbi:Ras-related small GTP-binding family protein [Euphorbia peplus]|nr:Ras-related small GTP-binding family protein [Euphorbia peplus]